jgi:hypothetical protein
MTTLTAIVTAHDESPTSILCNLGQQTVVPDQVLVGMSKPPASWQMPPLPFPVTLVTSPDEKDFGYRKRNRLITAATSHFVGFFCHDDSYSPEYIQTMIETAEAYGADVVFCPWNDIPNCKFAGCSSTLGNFIVRTQLLKEQGGFPAPHDGNEGMRDAALIEMLKYTGAKIVSAGALMYYHNIPFLPGTKVTVWGVTKK